MDQDYTASGFNSFLERSIDNLPQVNLDSQGPQSTAQAYDRTQITGAIGDSFNLGGVQLSGKDSTITLNDGQLVVNDSSTNNTINASSGNITYNDSSGNTVIQEGVLSDSTTGIQALDTQQRTVAQIGRFKDNTTSFKIFDTNGLAIAQFGQFPDGSVALKVAKTGYDAPTATNDQLIFNSAQNIFKISKSDTATLVIANPLTSGSTSTTTVAHGLSGIPGVIAYLQGNGNGYLANNTYYTLPWVGSFLGLVFQVRTDATNVYFDCTYLNAGSIGGLGTVSFKYYLLQETAN